MYTTVWMGDGPWMGRRWAVVCTCPGNCNFLLNDMYLLFKQSNRTLHKIFHRFVNTIGTSIILVFNTSWCCSCCFLLSVVDVSLKCNPKLLLAYQLLWHHPFVVGTDAFLLSFLPIDLENVRPKHLILLAYHW